MDSEAIKISVFECPYCGRLFKTQRGCDWHIANRCLVARYGDPADRGCKSCARDCGSQIIRQCEKEGLSFDWEGDYEIVIYESVSHGEKGIADEVVDKFIVNYPTVNCEHYVPCPKAAKRWARAMQLLKEREASNG